MQKTGRVVLFVFLFLTACGEAASSVDSNQDAPPATVPAEYAGMTNPLGAGAVGEGANIFQGYCASCHGETGKGDGYAGASLEPKPKDLAQLSAVVGDDYLYWRISKGNQGTAMIGWEGILEQEQIWQIVSFIRTLK